jgi:hypothetical protein
MPIQTIFLSGLIYILNLKMGVATKKETEETNIKFPEYGTKDGFKPPEER